MSQAEFARRIRVHPGTVTGWALGQSPLPGYAEALLDMLERLERIREMLK